MVTRPRNWSSLFLIKTLKEFHTFQMQLANILAGSLSISDYAILGREAVLAAGYSHGLHGSSRQRKYNQLWALP